MKTFLMVVVSGLLYIIVIAICWVGAAQFAVLFLPEGLWIPTACLGMLVGISVPIGMLTTMDYNKDELRE